MVKVDVHRTQQLLVDVEGAPPRRRRVVAASRSQRCGLRVARARLHVARCVAAVAAKGASDLTLTIAAHAKTVETMEAKLHRWPCASMPCGATLAERRRRLARRIAAAAFLNARSSVARAFASSRCCAVGGIAADEGRFGAWRMQRSAASGALLCGSAGRRRR
jgi:hypothetical protein